MAAPRQIGFIRNKAFLFPAIRILRSVSRMARAKVDRSPLKTEGDKRMRLLRVIAVVLLCAVAGIAQTNKGAISGTVFDSNGAAVPGASVTITNLGTGQKATITTTDTGAFSAQSLDPVTYSVMVEAKGFKKALLDHVKIDTAAVATANMTLDNRSVTDPVAVTAD